MHELIAKTDSNNFKNLKKFFKFEAYIGKKFEPSFYKKNKSQFKNIHLPTFFIKNGNRYNLNLVSKNELIKRTSFKILDKYFFLCKKTKIKNLVIHVGFYDSTIKDELKKTLLNLKIDLKNYLNDGVNLYFENVPKWFNQYNRNNPINSNLSEIQIFKKFIPKSKIIIDIDHLSINSAFEYFYKLNNSKFLNLSNEKLEKIYLNFAKKKFSHLRRKINKNIEKTVKVINPKLIHAVGSDFLNYTNFKKLPLIGEALPLNFDGKIQGRYVKDQINHRLWLKNKSKKLITVEIINRKDYSYIDEIKKSFEIIKKFEKC